MFSHVSVLGVRRVSQLSRGPALEVRANKAVQGLASALVLSQAQLYTPLLEMSAELLGVPQVHDLRGCP